MLLVFVSRYLSLHFLSRSFSNSLREAWHHHETWEYVTDYLDIFVAKGYSVMSQDDNNNKEYPSLYWIQSPWFSWLRLHCPWHSILACKSILLPEYLYSANVGLFRLSSQYFRFWYLSWIVFTKAMWLLYVVGLTCPVKTVLSFRGK